MPLLLAPLSRHDSSQSSGGTRKNSLMQSRADLQEAVSTGRNNKKAHSKGQPALSAGAFVMSYT